ATPPASASTAPTSRASAAPSQLIVLQLNGNEATRSESFTVQPGWQIVWQTEGTRFAVAVRGDQDLGTLVNQTVPSSGVASSSAGGRFHLEITATGPWTL